MVKVEVDKSSLKKLEAAIKKRRDKALLRANIKVALRSGAGIALDEARRLVPVDTGALRDDLALRAYGNAIVVRSTKDYAASVEFKVRSYLRAAQKGRESDIVEATRQEYKKIVI